MANIKKREGKNGTSYLIRSSCGYDTSGNQVVKSMTWKPAPGMTPKQIEKELNRQAVLFDERCAAQGAGNGNVKFEALAEQWLKEYAEPNNRARTVARLRQLCPRTFAAIGHIRVDKLTARHVQSFINNLGEEGVRDRRSFASAKQSFHDSFSASGMTQKALSEASGISRTTISALCRGDRVALATAEKLSAALKKPTKTLFTVVTPDTGLSPKTVQHYLSFVSSVMDYAFRFGMVQENPCKRVSIPSTPTKERECYTLEEAQRFLDSLQLAPTKYRAFFTLAIYGGFRRGELLGLEWQDIDFQNQLVKIRRTSLYLKDRGTFTDETKTKKSRRTLKLPVCVFSVLREHHIEQTTERLHMGDQWQDHGRLFTHLDGSPMHPNTPYHWLKRFCEETGQRFLGVHAFRHLNASLLINSGIDIKTVSSSLGHSQTTTTLNIYAHTFEEAQAKASEAIADLLAVKQA